MEARCSVLRVVEFRPSPAGRAPGGPPKKAQAEAYLERVAATARFGMMVWQCERFEYKKTVDKCLGAVGDGATFSG